jgi:uncharacterized protein YjbI with pentapeptide repeats
MEGKCIGYKKDNCDQDVVYQNLCKNCLGKKFEDDVADIFRLMGYKVEHNVQIADRQVDLYIEVKVGITTIRGLVECKYHRDANVSMDEVSQIAAAAGPWLRERKIDKAYLITTKGFAATAKANAEQNGIECYTYDQLLSSLIDFTPYLKRMIEEFESDPLYHTYVDLYCKRYQLNDKSKKLRSAQNFKNYPWKFVRKRLKNYMKRWLELPYSNHTSILGDFGSGKTSFCKIFAYLTAKRHLLNTVKNPRIPLLIKLGNYARLEKGSIQTMVTDFLVNECDLKTNYSTFQKFMKAGKLLLLLDGFDEMAMQVDQKIRVRNFELLAELAVEPNKVILTGRPGYFPNFREMERIMGQIPKSTDIYDRLGQDLMDNLKKMPAFDILMIQPFFQKQINNFLQKQSDRLRELGCNDWQILREAIHKTYNLEDLAKRPVLLDIIVQTVPRLLNNEEIKEINISKLYKIYTDFWLERDWGKGEMRRLIKSEDRLLFMQELALELYSCNMESIHYEKLPERVQNYFKIDRESHLDYFEHDIRTCTFLNRSDDGYYKFIHKSFMEYFIATRLIAEIKMNQSELFYTLLLSDEIIKFISESMDEGQLEILPGWLQSPGISKSMAKSQLEILQILQSRLHFRSNSKILNENILKILIHKKKGKLVGLDMSNCKFDGINLSNCIFEKCNIDRASFEVAHLSQIKFSGSSLMNTNFQNAELLYIKFVKCSLNNANFKRTNFGFNLIFAPLHRSAGKVTFNHSILKNINLRGTKFFDSSFVNVDLNKANLQNTVFLRCNFGKSKFKRTNLNGAFFSGCNLGDAHFCDSYMRKIRFLCFYLKETKPGRLNEVNQKSNNFFGTVIENCNLHQSQFIGQLCKNTTIRSTLMSETKIIGTIFAGSKLIELNLKDAKIVGSNCVESIVKDNNYENTSFKRSDFGIKPG